MMNAILLEIVLKPIAALLLMPFHAIGKSVEYLLGNRS